MQTTTESVPDVASRVDKVPAQSFSSPELTQNFTAHLVHDPNCGCLPCLTTCDEKAQAGLIPTNSSWWKVQRHFILDVDLCAEVAQ